MIKVAFFFDDNKNIQTFSELSLNKVGLISVGFFKKSEEDIERLTILKPQLIMTDDNFADMSESEFISEIKYSFDGAVFIKFGNINNFERVRKAFKLGYTDYVSVEDYLVDYYEMFLDIVSTNDFYTEESYDVRVMREKELKKYAYGYIDSFSQRHNINPDYVIFASIAMLNFDYIVKEYWSYEKEQLLFAFKNIINELMDGFENGEFFFEYYSVVQFAFTPTETVDKFYVKKAIKQICETLTKTVGILSFCIVCDDVYSLGDYLSKVHNEFEKRGKIHLVAHDYIYFLNDLKSKFVEDFNATKRLKTIETMFNNLDFEGAVNEIKSLSQISPSIEKISSVSDYIQCVFNDIKQLDIQNQVGLVHDDDIYAMLSAYNLPVIIEYFVCCIYAISDFISEDKYISLQISKFLQEHLADNITLQDISDNFNFEYTYTSKYFTQIMGMPFKKYFNNLRLSTALNLLKATDLKCYEIASRCGYNNYEHFSRIFYKKYGVWPKDIVRNKKH